jgi:hypothetical protein
MNSLPFSIKNIRLLILFLLGMMVSSCVDDVFGIRGEGPVISQDRTASGFTGADMKVNGIVHISRGADYAIRVEAQGNIQEILRTEVRGGVLNIHFGNHTVGRYTPINVYITMPDLTRASVKGAGYIYIQGPFTAPEIELSVSGAGDIVAFHLTANRINSDITGSGRISLEGKAGTSRLRISGSGQIDSFNMPTEHAEVRIQGAGNCNLQSHKTLKAHIIGSGKIYYQGNPVIDLRTTGAGRVIDSN